MVTLPILATILLGLCIIATIAISDENPAKSFRKFISFVFAIVTIWLCYTGPGETAPLVCAIIYTSWTAIAYFISIVNGEMSRNAIEHGIGNLLFIMFIITGLIQCAIWIPWTFG